MTNANRLIGPKVSVRFAGKLLVMVILLLAVCTTASAKGEVGGTKFTVQQLQQLVDEAYAKFKNVKDGKNADYIPILATVPSELFGVVIALRDGTTLAAGDADYAFAIESVSKPFTAALVMQQYGGPQAIIEKIGVEPTGLPFNSKLAIEILKARSANPLVDLGRPAFEDGSRRRHCLRRAGRDGHCRILTAPECGGQQRACPKGDPLYCG